MTRYGKKLPPELIPKDRVTMKVYQYIYIKYNISLTQKCHWNLKKPKKWPNKNDSKKGGFCIIWPNLPADAAHIRPIRVVIFHTMSYGYSTTIEIFQNLRPTLPTFFDFNKKALLNTLLGCYKK